MKRARILISGNVQGVSFRYHTQQKARSLGLVGYVRNLTDGRVEVVAEGDDRPLGDLLAFCKDGPSSASVSDVQVDHEKPTGQYTIFSIRH